MSVSIHTRVLTLIYSHRPRLQSRLCRPTCEGQLINPTHASHVRWRTFVLATFVRIVTMPIGQLPARSGCLHVFSLTMEDRVPRWQKSWGLWYDQSEHISSASLTRWFISLRFAYFLVSSLMSWASWSCYQTPQQFLTCCQVSYKTSYCPTSERNCRALQRHSTAARFSNQQLPRYFSRNARCR